MASLLFSALVTAALTNASDVAEATLCDRCEQAFRVCGTIADSNPRNKYPVAATDASGAMLFSTATTNDLSSARPGDIVIITGRTRPNDSGCILAFAEHIEHIGHAAPPPPKSLSIAEIKAGKGDNRHVRTTGVVTEVFKDEIAPRWTYLTLCQNGMRLYVTVREDAAEHAVLLKFLGAKISVSGICLPRDNGLRHQIGRVIQVLDRVGFEMLQPPPTDPFAVPELTDSSILNPEDILTRSHCRITGTVLAVWNGKDVLVRRESRALTRLEVTGDDLPAYGERIEAVGKPETDLYRINLSSVIWRRMERPTAAPEVARRVKAAQILSGPGGEDKVYPTFHGQAVRLTGIVQNIDDDSSGPVATLKSDSFLITTDSSALPHAFDGISVGCTLDVAGTCIVETENWHPGSAFPHVRGIRLVLRHPSDVRILARPPWWTPKRLLIVIGALIALLVGGLFWIRGLNRIIIRRTRQLLKEELAHARAEMRVDERTRLAVELHDSMSQTLTGVSFQIDAAEQARQKDPSQIKKFLDIARQTLQSCREELKNCLWDLRNNALEESNADVAIRKTIEPQIGDTELTTDIRIDRKTLMDNTFHALLRILRELSVNAVRHGKAKHIKLSGCQTKERLSFSVRDDGCGFDPNNRPGVDEGHFGLLGVQERVDELDGSLTIDSTPGQGTLVTIELKP